LAAARALVRSQLLAARTAAGPWVGELSTSALSTATAVSAFALIVQHAGVDEADDRSRIAAGIAWLAAHANDDGGWGDTDRSYSNIATTMLAVAAFHLAGVADRHAPALDRAAAYTRSQGDIAGLRRRYGRDRTFAVPILTNCALAGLVPWAAVPPLPFELACLPQSFYRFARMPVVSYAVPALVAIGQARYFHRRPWFPLTRLLRRIAIRPSLRVLEQMQPASGGYLEATPLTSFVIMSLAASGQAGHPVTRRGVQFLRDSMRSDGSWPIDTNLATWVTTLAINALADGGEDVAQLGCLDWLLSCQHRVRHPFTGADPGGWGWTDLSGAVPDADDTPGALLALSAWHRAPSSSAADRTRIEEAARRGLTWLLGLQNRDGGWPTFCRGWGRLPFDRSGADLTAHALRALRVWPERVPAAQAARAVAAGFRFLERQQRPDGSWVPLWFGNQDQPGEENPVYGTARVLRAYRDWEQLDDPAARRGGEWLRAAQNADGGWGGGPAVERHSGGTRHSSIEETAVAVEALSAAAGHAEWHAAWQRGAAWLVAAVEAGRHSAASPIGFYFAKLWYYEQLYPLTFLTAALGQALRALTVAGDRSPTDR
jgi:squalene-hopene/tetraprenyl-beta-curcumene cyclase